MHSETHTHTHTHRERERERERERIRTVSVTDTLATVVVSHPPRSLHLLSLTDLFIFFKFHSVLFLSGFLHFCDPRCPLFFFLQDDLLPSGHLVHSVKR